MSVTAAITTATVLTPTTIYTLDLRIVPLGAYFFNPLSSLSGLNWLLKDFKPGLVYTSPRASFNIANRPYEYSACGRFCQSSLLA